MSDSLADVLDAAFRGSGGCASCAGRKAPCGFHRSLRDVAERAVHEWLRGQREPLAEAIHKGTYDYIPPERPRLSLAECADLQAYTAGVYRSADAVLKALGASP